MKIVQIGIYPLDSSYIKGGVESSVHGLASELVKENHVFVIDFPRHNISSDSTELTGDLTVYRFKSRSVRNLSAILRVSSILRTIKNIKPDVCHIHSTSLVSFTLFLLLRLSNFPSLLTVHGLVHIEQRLLWQKNRRIKDFLKYITYSLTEFLFLSMCRLVIVDTQYVADEILNYRKQRKILRLPHCNIIPQGVNQLFFELERIVSNKHLLSVGAISRRKGHLYLIRAMKKVHEIHPDFSLKIVGALSDNNYYQKMLDDITRNGLDENIEVIPNASFDQLLRFYTAAEVFILYSEEESQGIVFCEAMAVGLAVVATNVGGIPNVVMDGENGILTDFGDTDSFAHNIIKLLDNDELRKNLQTNSKTLSNQYQWSLITKKIVLLYNELIKKESINSVLNG